MHKNVQCHHCSPGVIRRSHGMRQLQLSGTSTYSEDACVRIAKPTKPTSAPLSPWTARQAVVRIGLLPGGHFDQSRKSNDGRVTASQHDCYQDPDTDTAKQKSANVNSIIYTHRCFSCCDKLKCEKGLFCPSTCIYTAICVLLFMLVCTHITWVSKTGIKAFKSTLRSGAVQINQGHVLRWH